MVNAKRVKLPLTNKRFIDAKVMDLAKQKLHRLTVDAKSLKVLDGAKLFKAERKAYRKKYFGFSAGDYSRLKDKTDNNVAIWVTTPSFKGKRPSSKAQHKAMMIKDKKDILAHLSATTGITVIKSRKEHPVVEVRGKKADILKFAKHPSVGRMYLLVPLKPETYSLTTEQNNIGWLDILWLWPPITNEIKIAMLESCHPSGILRTHSDQTGDANDKMAYLPNINEEQTATGCSTDDIKHADMTHSILYGHIDTQYTPDRGRHGMLSGLSTQVSSLAMNGMSSTPGSLLTAGDLANALFSVNARPLASAPNVLSISAWPTDFAETGNPSCTDEEDLAMRSLDWQTTMLPSHPLVVFAAGNAGYEPSGSLSNWYCCGGSTSCSSGPATPPGEGGGGSTTCYDGIDNDGDQDIDCDDDECVRDDAPYEHQNYEHWFCKYRHYVVPKLRNALVVGAMDTQGRTGGQNPEWDQLGGSVESLENAFSSWRTPKHTHNDRRLPHVVAPGRRVQAADHTLQSYADPTLFRWHASWDSASPSGTSFATPMVAGYAAYAMRATIAESSNRLKAQQATRAIVMASARHNPMSSFYDSWPGGHRFERTRLSTGAADVQADSRKHRDGAGAIDTLALVKLLNSGDGPGDRSWDTWTINIPSPGESWDPAPKKDWPPIPGPPPPPPSASALPWPGTPG